MTARLSLLDQQEESPWADEHTTLDPQPHTDQEKAARHSQVSNSAQVPMGIYSSDGQTYNQQGFQTQPGSDNNHQATEHYPAEGRAELNRESGITDPSIPASATTTFSHDLIEVDADEHTPPQNGTSQPVSMLLEHTARSTEETTTHPPPLSEVDAQRHQEQRSETYNIRHINWTDMTGQLRQSPVLVQNNNGPCPLLALVNTLVLRAPKDSQPPIIKALQTREQISLGLLIEALFDEVTTNLNPDDEFPDIEALSKFLTMLHTGMNVNPRLTLVCFLIIAFAMLTLVGIGPRSWHFPSH